MFLKALCLSLATGSFVLATLPPPSSKTISPEKDKIKNEGRLFTRATAKYLPVFMALGAVIETALYLFLLTRSDSRLKYATQREFEAVQRLKELKNWHVIAAALALAGGWFRRWSFATLGRFFTFQLTIRSGHRLVQTGPYKYLRHPSYTGAILVTAMANVLLFHEGLWGVMMAIGDRYSQQYLAPMFPHLLSLIRALPFWQTLTGPNGGVVFTALMIATMLGGLVKRVKNEEEMLKGHFRKEWDDYASQRWRFIPFLY